RRRLVARRLGEVADRVDAAVGGAVHLDVIHRGAAGDGAARVARAARLGGRPGAAAALAVERLAQDARQGGLAHPARPAEQEGVVNAAGAERVSEGAGDVLLPGDLREGLRPVLAGEDEIGHGRRKKETGAETPPPLYQRVAPGTRSVRYRCSLPGLAGFTDVASPGTANLFDASQPLPAARGTRRCA